MIVYIVTEDYQFCRECGGSSEILGVYDNEKAAFDCKRLREKEKDFYADDYTIHISEWEVEG